MSLLLDTGCSLSQPNPDIPEQKIAFNYTKLSQDDLNFLSRFDIIVTSHFPDDETVKRLKSKKIKLIHYDWLPGIYHCTHHDDWEEMVYQNRFLWALDPQDSDPNPMGEKYGCMDLFYDMGNDDLIDVRVDHIVSIIKTNHYDGVFFDWGSGWDAFKENRYDFLIEAFKKRHPDINYNDKVNEFIKRLKDKGLFIMMNRGFRSDHSQLDRYVDVDVIESMFTTTECNNVSYEIFIASTGLTKACDTWFNTVSRSIDLATKLPNQARSANRNIQFLFLNYAFPYYKETRGRTKIDDIEYILYEESTDRQALFYSLACSYMGESSGFTAGPNVGLQHVKDDVYFYQLGRAESDIQKIKDDVYMRYFSRGIVVVSGEETTLEIVLPKGINKIFDLYNKKIENITHNKVSLKLVSQVYPSGSKHPIGRIYLYEH